MSNIERPNCIRRWENAENIIDFGRVWGISAQGRISSGAGYSANNELAASNRFAGDLGRTVGGNAKLRGISNEMIKGAWDVTTHLHPVNGSFRYWVGSIEIRLEQELSAREIKNHFTPLPQGVSEEVVVDAVEHTLTKNFFKILRYLRSSRFSIPAARYGKWEPHRM